MMRAQIEIKSKTNMICTNCKVVELPSVATAIKKMFNYELGNYRPISILSPVNKIFETIIQRRLIDFWDKYNLFSNLEIKPFINASRIDSLRYS